MVRDFNSSNRAHFRSLALTLKLEVTKQFILFPIPSEYLDMDLSIPQPNKYQHCGSEAT